MLRWQAIVCTPMTEQQAGVAFAVVRDALRSDLVLAGSSDPRTSLRRLLGLSLTGGTIQTRTLNGSNAQDAGSAMGMVATRSIA